MALNHAVFYYEAGRGQEEVAAPGNQLWRFIWPGDGSSDRGSTYRAEGRIPLTLERSGVSRTVLRGNSHAMCVSRGLSKSQAFANHAPTPRKVLIAFCPLGKAFEDAVREIDNLGEDGAKDPASGLAQFLHSNGVERVHVKHITRRRSVHPTY